MTPKEKAVDLINKFFKSKHQPFGYNDAKNCALIAVDELIYFSSNQLLSVDFDGDYYCDEDFFIAVKQEIEKL